MPSAPVPDGLYMSGYYCDEDKRMKVEGSVRKSHNPPCGDRLCRPRIALSESRYPGLSSVRGSHSNLLNASIAL